MLSKRNQLYGSLIETSSLKFVKTTLNKCYFRLVSNDKFESVDKKEDKATHRK